MIPLGTRRVLVTGAGSGIGRAVAVALLEAGGQVALTGRRVEPLQQLADTWPTARVLPADLADPAQRTGLVARAQAALGGLDGVVHSAGVVHHALPGHTDDTQIHAQLEVNLVAPLRLGEEALAVLEAGGAQVFIASTAALRPLRTTLYYSAAKAGLVAGMQVLALAGAARGLRINALHPGVVDTAMIHTPRPGAETSPAALAALHPLGRLGHPAELAATVLHLLAAPWATGSAWTLDGGLLLRE